MQQINLPYAVGGNIRAARLRNRMTADQLGEITGISRKNITKYESGLMNPSLWSLRKIAIALEVTTDWLLDLPRTPESDTAYKEGQADAIATMSRAIELIKGEPL